MLKITTESAKGSTRLLLEGRLTGPWVEELSRCWDALGAAQPGVTIDLTGVSFISPEGKALLVRLWQDGATFHAAGCLTRAIIEEITQRPGAWTGCSGEHQR